MKRNLEALLKGAIIGTWLIHIIVCLLDEFASGNATIEAVMNGF